MKYFTILILAGFTLSSCLERDKKQFIDIENVYAWCIVPFDSVERSPMERINMLKRLGIKKYAYDWREKNLSEMADELRLAEQNEIEVIAVWLWLDDNWDAVGALNPLNERLLSIVKEVGYNGQIWVSFNSNYFAGRTDQLALEKGIKMISYLSDKAKELGCKIALYNHGDWFGEPANQIKIIKALAEKDLGIVYNFHHAHKQIEAFPEIVEMMVPYLWYVNLNGLRKEGPKILTIGKGDYEKGMIELLNEKGYSGDYGILGHIEDADVEAVLNANLEGLKKFSNQ
ncbi:MAG: TIM barrel protein [Reichenbachiella sp.]